MLIESRLVSDFEREKERERELTVGLLCWLLKSGWTKHCGFDAIVEV